MSRAGIRELLIDGEDALVADGAGQRAGDDLASILEGLLGRHAERLIAAEQRFDDAVHGAKENATLAKNVRAELGGERGLEDVRRAHADGPREGALCGLTGGVLVHCE
eukprot:scaffold23240_cov27-Tisochrysis_lutea.AAC.3